MTGVQKCALPICFNFRNRWKEKWIRYFDIQNTWRFMAWGFDALEEALDLFEGDLVAAEKQEEAARKKAQVD